MFKKRPWLYFRAKLGILNVFLLVTGFCWIWGEAGLGVGVSGERGEIGGGVSSATPLLSYPSLHGENAVSHQLIGKTPAHCEICSEFQQIDIFSQRLQSELFSSHFCSLLTGPISCLLRVEAKLQPVSFSDGHVKKKPDFFFGENIPRQRRSTFSTGSRFILRC